MCLFFFTSSSSCRILASTRRQVEEICENPYRKRNGASPSDPERAETETRDEAFVQDGDFACLGLCARWNGVCPISLTQKRVMAAEPCGKNTKTVSTTSILHFHVGETVDPAIWFPLVQLKTWFELQRENPEHKLDKIEVARAWVVAPGTMRMFCGQWVRQEKKEETPFPRKSLDGHGATGCSCAKSLWKPCDGSGDRGKNDCRQIAEKSALCRLKWRPRNCTSRTDQGSTETRSRPLCAAPSSIL